MVYCNLLKNNYLRLARYTVLGVSYRLNYRIDSEFQKDCSIRQSGIYFFLCYIHNPKIFLTMFETIFEYPDPNVTSDSKGFIVKGNIKQSINPLVHLQISPRVTEQLQIRWVLL